MWGATYFGLFQEDIKLLNLSLHDLPDYKAKSTWMKSRDFLKQKANLNCRSGRTEITGWADHLAHKLLALVNRSSISAKTSHGG